MAVRRPGGRRRRRRATSGRSRPASTVAAAGPGRRRRAARLVQRLPAPRRTSCWRPGASRTRPGDPLPVPRLGVRAGRRVPGHPAVRQGHRRRRSTGPSSALVPARVEQWHGWVFANVSGDAPPLAEQLGNAGMVVDGYDAAAAGARRPARVRGRGQLEGDRRELPGVLPLRADPPRAVRGHAAGLRPRLPGRAGRLLGRRPAGAAGRRADDVAGRAQPRRADPGAAGAPDRARSATRRCCRRCWSARTRTT